MAPDMNANDASLIQDFMRVRETSVGTALEIAVVQWDGPACPYERWKRYRSWKNVPTSERLAAAQRKALEQSRFFRICRNCGMRHNVGHMHEKDLCQGCAERYFGVVY